MYLLGVMFESLLINILLGEIKHARLGGALSPLVNQTARLFFFVQSVLLIFLGSTILKLCRVIDERFLKSDQFGHSLDSRNRLLTIVRS